MDKVPEAYFMFNTAHTPPCLMRAPPAVFGKYGYLASRPESDEKVAAGVELKLQPASLAASIKTSVAEAQAPGSTLRFGGFEVWTVASSSILIKLNLFRAQNHKRCVNGCRISQGNVIKEKRNDAH